MIYISRNEISYIIDETSSEDYLVFVCNKRETLLEIIEEYDLNRRNSDIKNSIEKKDRIDLIGFDYIRNNIYGTHYIHKEYSGIDNMIYIMD